MILIPALELLSGNIVRLRDNDRNDPIVLSEDPMAAIKTLQKDGALFFHITDLDAAFDDGNHDDLLRQLADRMIPFQIGGGIRTPERAGELLELGADAVVLGTLFYKDPDAAKDLVGHFPNRLKAALDVLDGEVTLNVRSKGSGHDLEAALEILLDTGVRNVIYHRLSSEDVDVGPDLDGLRRLLQHEEIGVHAHCSINKVEELESLIDLADHGLASVIVNHATAEHSLNIERALQVLG